MSDTQTFGGLGCLDIGTECAATPRPDVEIWTWALVEIFGHRKHYGRTSEVERFGTKMLRVDVPLAPAAPLLVEEESFATFFYGGAAIFSFTPMTEEAAREWASRASPQYRPISRLPPSEEDDDDDFTDKPF